jgi:tetratricopeptide (TPR) repeat protein
VLARRNRALFLTAATALVILVAGVVVTTSLWVQSRANRARAESEASKALATLAYLQKMLSSPDPAQVGHDVRVLDLLERSDATMGQAFADQPEVEATVRMTIGLTYAGLDFWDAAKPHFAAALELRRNVLGEEHPDTLTAMHNLGISLQMQGRSSGQIDEAEQLYNRVLELRRKVLGEEHPDTISSIEKVSWIFRDRKQFTEAEPLFYRAVELRRRVQGEDHPDTITSVSYLSHLLGDQGKLEEAEKLSRDVLARSRRVLGELHPDTVARISTLGYRLVQQGRWDEAEPIYREALTFHREVFGDRHPTTLHVQRRLIEVLEQLGKLEEAGGLRANLGDSP